MPNRYAEAVRELVQSKIEEAKPAVVLGSDSGKAPPVVNIMQALKESMHARGREKVSAALRRGVGKN